MALALLWEREMMPTATQTMTVSAPRGWKGRGRAA